MFSTSISYFVCLLDILPGSGVNCSLVLEQQEPRRRTTTAVRDGRRQQQLVGVVGGHGRRGTGACSALLTTMPRHGVRLNSLCTCLLKWIDREYYLFFIAIYRFTDASFFWSTTRFHFLYRCLFLFTCFSLPAWLIHHVWKFKNQKKICSFFAAAVVSLCVRLGCNVDRLRLVSEHLKH